MEMLGGLITLAALDFEFDLDLAFLHPAEMHKAAQTPPPLPRRGPQKSGLACRLVSSV